METNHVRARRELAAIAILQARLDENLDYFDMFLPLVLGCIHNMENLEDGLSATDIHHQLAKQCDVEIPEETCKILLTRAKKAGALNRNAGRYFVNDAFDFGPYDFQVARSDSYRGYLELGKSFSDYLRSEYQVEVDAEQSIERLLQFLDARQVPLALDPSVIGNLNSIDHLTKSERQTARFVVHACSEEPRNRLLIAGIVQGLVMKQALFLPEITGSKRKFDGLTAYLDTKVLLGALGYEGEASHSSAMLFLETARGAGISLAAFEGTLQEIRRILDVYVDRLGTSAGVRSLLQTDVSRHFLKSRYTPADIIQMRALMANQVQRLGVRVVEYPTHVADYTEDEMSLANCLRDKRDNDRPWEHSRDVLRDHRVSHDVNAVAAVMTLRKGRNSRTLDDARAVFVTKSSAVLRQVVGWFQAQGRSGVPPVVHQFWLSSVLWLKGRQVSSDAMLGELVALCQGALLPRASTWQRFSERLADLVESGDLDSDESISVLCSDLTDELLSRAEEEEVLGDDADPDADTIRDVIQRVQESRDSEIGALSAEVAEERSRRVALESRADKVASGAAKVLSRVCFAVGVHSQSPLCLWGVAPWERPRFGKRSQSVC